MRSPGTGRHAIGFRNARRAVAGFAGTVAGVIGLVEKVVYYFPACRRGLMESRITLRTLDLGIENLSIMSLY